MDTLSTDHRRHTFVWDDPAATAAAGRKLRPLDYLEAIRAGELSRPPIGGLMGFDLVEVAPGKAVFVCAPQEFHCNPMGFVHGGLAATLIDSATGIAVYSTLGAGEWFSTIDLTTNFIKAMQAGMGEIRCEGNVVHAGRSIATAEARITSADGDLVAYGHAACRLFRQPAKGTVERD